RLARGRDAMKCQACDKAATLHVTDVVAGQPVEYHVCDDHVQDLDNLKPTDQPKSLAAGPMAFWEDPQLSEALRDPVAQQKMAAYLLPALCLALLDEKPEVRIAAAFRLMMLGPDARSAMGALRDALRDPDERVRKAAGIALEFIQVDQGLPWMF